LAPLAISFVFGFNALVVSAQIQENYATKEEEEMITNGFVFFPPKKIRPVNTPSPQKQESQSSNTKEVGKVTEFSINDLPKNPQVNIEPERKVEEQPIHQTQIYSDPQPVSKMLDTPYKKQRQGVAIYLRAGNEVAVGVKTDINEQLNLRVEYANADEKMKDKTHEMNNYSSKIYSERVGAYLDWFPLGNPFKLVAGVSANHINQSLNIKPNQPVLMNGKLISASANNKLNIDFSFPKYTPYFGIGLDFSKKDSYGWSGFGELGILIGRPDAAVITTLIGNGGVAETDIADETKKVRKSIYKWSGVPKASLGLSYRY